MLDLNYRLRTAVRDRGWYARADGVVLVYDVCDKDSFDRLVLWRKEVRVVWVG